MSLTTRSTTPPAVVRVLRVDAVQRAPHWINALLFTVLIATAIPLYFGSFFGVILPRHPVEQVHLWVGIALPVPIIISLVGPWGRQMRRDVRRFNYWTHEEIAWMRSFGRSPLAAEKFNPGQKLNAVFIAASILVMLVTGSMLKWFRFFSVSLREGATFVHDCLAAGIVIVIVGHIVMAITHRESLRSIFRGTVSEPWASTHAPTWLRELRDTHEDPAS